MSYPRGIPWQQLHAAGFRQVVCLTDRLPQYDPAPLTVLYSAELQDLVGGRGPHDPEREEELIVEAARAVIACLEEGHGVAEDIVCRKLDLHYPHPVRVERDGIAVRYPGNVRALEFVLDVEVQGILAEDVLGVLLHNTFEHLFAARRSYVISHSVYHQHPVPFLSTLRYLTAIGMLRAITAVENNVAQWKAGATGRIVTEHWKVLGLSSESTAFELWAAMVGRYTVEYRNRPS